MFKKFAFALSLALSAVSFCAQTQANPSSAQEQLQQQWQAYINQSQALRKLDQDSLRRELKKRAYKKPLDPKKANEFGFDYDQPVEWFKTPEAARLMEAILSFQTPSGGWSKRTDMTQKRRFGMAYGSESKYIPTFDNKATSVQMAMLAKAISATGNKAYIDAFDRGLTLIIQAQFPNGGWPQNYPLVGDYHNMLTYNDNLIANLMALLGNIAEGKDEYAFTSPQQRQKARVALDNAFNCVLNTQVIVGGKPTIWGAQHDPFSLMPVKARAFEMASLSAGESANLVMFLMKQKNPSPALVNAIYDAADWFAATKISGKSWTRGDKELKDDANSHGVWARFYEPGTNKPLFGDRDGSVHYALKEISQERINGYGWYGNWPAKVLAKLPEWAKKHPRPAP